MVHTGQYLCYASDYVKHVLLKSVWGFFAIILTIHYFVNNADVTVLHY